ncbi:hypothetical protein L798_09112 [Zootermopsis nevadensis]|uniref:Uncharacterized protein n=1 Tax=Zootermopsis nevadensis TaxID=136037 RepID=A0A067R1E9_ZOONE|nr:hypothetical protein L798_09112 [Zootermopsis nevadensis]
MLEEVPVLTSFQTVGLAEVVHLLGQRYHQIFCLWTTFSGSHKIPGICHQVKQ